MEPGISKVKHILAVGSGKGGVGKSTVTTNLAYALSLLGHKVGLMDADIYGPSQPVMLGVSEDEGIKTEGNKLYPIERNGILFISMGLLVKKGGPVVWRAPMAIKMIQQFLGNVVWGELDILLIDLPPGTGDVQLTLAQQASLSGAIIVTTPQDVSLEIAKKGLTMFEQVSIPILGIVENMSGFKCPHCGEVTDVFKSGGGKKLSQTLKVPFLGSIPLDPKVMEASEKGSPLLSKEKESPSAKSFIKLAENLFKEIEILNKEGKFLSPLSMGVDQGERLIINWSDGHKGIYSSYNLRLECKCATCVDENTNKRKLNVNSIPLNIKIVTVRPTGRYGLNIHFSDGHGTGIYKHTYLREICECMECVKKRGKSFDV